MNKSVLRLLVSILCIQISYFADITYAHSNNPKVIMPSVDVLIDVGHGGIDGGTSYENILEKDINLAIAKKLYSILTNSNIQTAVNRVDDYALSDENKWLKQKSRHIRDLAQRMQLSRELEPKLMISLHVNWSKNTNRSGVQIIHQNNEDSKSLGQHVGKALGSLYDGRYHISIGNTFYLMNYVRCPIVIVEMGFISHHRDRMWLTNANKQNQIARAIADGITSYLQH